MLDGPPGAYVLRGAGSEVDVPATLQATIGARIDRVSGTAKQTLGAAAVIGTRFDAGCWPMCSTVVDVTPLIEANWSTRCGSADAMSMRFVIR